MAAFPFPPYVVALAIGRSAYLQVWQPASWMAPAAALALAVLAVTSAPSAHAQAPALAQASAQDAAAAPQFDVFQFVVEGNSVLTPLQIERAVTPMLGEKRTLKDVEAARAALEKSYQDAGYLTVVVSIPPQSVDGGEVTLRVVEADIDRLRVKGAEFTLPSNVRKRLPELAEGKVPNFNTVQSQLAALNRSGDSRITPVLRAGKLPGTVEVQLDVDDQLPLHGSVDLSNRQTPNTTPERLSASVRYDNLWQLGHSVGLSVQTSPQRRTDVRVAALNYVAPYGSGGDAASLFYVNSRSEFASLANTPGLGLLGNSDILGLRNTWRLVGTTDFLHSLSAGLDYRNIKQDLTLQGGGSTGSPIIYTPLVANYSATLTAENRSTTFEASSSLGLRGLLGNSDEKFQAKRSGASANFLQVRLGLGHSQTIERWIVSGKFDYQKATGPLVPNDQFVGGGADSVRGYLEGERAGDGGWRASLEVRTPQWSPAGANSAWRLTGLAFFDAAQLDTLQAVYPQPDRTTLRGTGVGLRVVAPAGFVLEADAARALVAGDTTKAGSKRVHAKAIWSF